MPRTKHPRLAQIDRAFTYHQPASNDVSAQLDKIRATFKAIAVKMHKALPENREAALALTKLEVASMHALSAVVRENGEPSTPVEVHGKAPKAAKAAKRTVKRAAKVDA